jgi:hypothetical protein
MTRTGPADVAMSVCAHATTSRPVPARPGFCELVSLGPASGEPTIVRAVFPGLASFKPGSGRLPSRSGRPQPDRPVPPHQLVPAPGPPRPPCPRSPALGYPLYLYLLEWPAAALRYLKVQLIPEGTCYAY